MNKKIYILAGLIICSFIIYTRVLRIRLPRELNLFIPSINWFLLVITIYSILFAIFIIYKNIMRYFQKEEPETKLNKILLEISLFIEKAISEVYNIYPLSYDTISKFAHIYYKFFSKRSAAFLIWILCSIRLAIALIFLVDVVYFFKFDYFYKSLFLLIIPLLINIMILILKDFTTNLKDIEAYLDIKRLGNESDTDSFYDISFKEEFKYLTKKDLEYYFCEYKLCYNLKEYFEAYDYFSAWYTIRQNIFIYTIFLIGWIILIIKNSSIIVI